MMDPPTRPKVLILSLADWFGSARLPYALREAGFEVGVAAEPGTLIAQSRSIDRFFPISVARVRIGMLSPLIRAIEVFDPLVIIPGDEAVVHLLYRLAQGEGPRPLSAQFAALIRRSVGDTARLKARTNRDQSRAAAAKAGILVPRNRVIASFADAEAFVAQIGWPVVLKREGTAGGHGVRICRGAEALAAGYRELEAMKLDTQSRSLKDRAHRLYWNLRSGFRLAGDLCRESGGGPKLSAEEFIVGTPAFHTAAVVEGNTVAGFSVLVRASYPSATGPSSIVQFIEHPEMAEAARRLGREFGFTGLCGLDFIIDQNTGRSYFLEFNARPTPVSHLGRLAGSDLCTALKAGLIGREPPPAGLVQPLRVALFPQDWRRAPAETDRPADYLDIPWNDPPLIEAYRRCLPADVLLPAEPEKAVGG